MENELLLLGGLGVLILAVLILAKFGKQIVQTLLIVGILAGALYVGWQWLDAKIQEKGTGGVISDVADIARAITPRNEPGVVYKPTARPGGGFVAGMVTALALIAVGVAGYFWIRWRLAERIQTPRRGSRRSRAQAPVVYVVEEEQNLGYPVFDGGELWTEEDIFQF